jgi:PmbA protein
MFEYTRNQFQDLLDQVAHHSKRLGASAWSADVSESFGLAVNVRKGAVETIEQNRDKGLSVTVYAGQRRGNASTSDFSAQAISQTLEAAFHIARFTAEDDCAGLPEQDLLATEHRDFDQYHPWDLTAEHAIGLAKRMERAAFDVSPLVSNSEGASVNTGQSHYLSANSLGFVGGGPYSRHTMAVSPIAGAGEDMQRDDWYSSASHVARLAEPERIGRYAAQRALAKLGARKLKTRRVPVLFEAPLAAGLLGSLVQATSGSALYRRSTFMLDSLGKAVLPAHIDVIEDPFIPAELGSGSFDSEGVRTSRRELVSGGVLQGYFLSTYSARKLGMKTTGNAGGAHNLSLTSRLTPMGDDLPAMLRRMGTGLLVTDLMGQGVNYVTGDYSRGASGYWVHRGVIQYPVQEITIAGNLAQMFKGIVAVGADVMTRGTKRTGSILIDEMAIAG